MTLIAQWTDDCQGKKDFDCEIVSLSTRYWPRGGGFFSFDTATRQFTENEDRPQIKPSAKAAILLDHTKEGGGTELVAQKFEGETFEEVAAQVEAWAKEQHAKITDAVRRLYSSTPE